MLTSFGDFSENIYCDVLVESSNESHSRIIIRGMKDNTFLVLIIKGMKDKTFWLTVENTIFVIIYDVKVIHRLCC